MSQPTFYPEGVTGQPNDTQLRVLKKVLGTYQNLAGASSANDPLPQEGIKQTKKKILAAIG